MMISKMMVMKMTGQLLGLTCCGSGREIPHRWKIANTSGKVTKITGRIISHDQYISFTSTLFFTVLEEFQGFFEFLNRPNSGLVCGPEFDMIVSNSPVIPLKYNTSWGYTLDYSHNSDFDNNKNSILFSPRTDMRGSKTSQSHNVNRTEQIKTECELIHFLEALLSVFMFYVFYFQMN